MYNLPAENDMREKPQESEDSDSGLSTTFRQVANGEEMMSRIAAIADALLEQYAGSLTQSEAIELATQAVQEGLQKLPK
ncbi:MAG: hypothetical protein UT58_C0023G0006 [Microgenomates group bacterium GW2011_GWC1_39_7b]|uniref:Uncharacterized protein n=2 Tax=Candidatus Daviesiibacteriota TaxID=1752718 RepID=A0A1F5N0C2_9BACT|nr:MAG: hypothetical protein UT58_C0023G0006 [Microgenomates group bacterium GW2011_GWC1_39_7b]KKS14382.1 MAG: hypothetical protein UU67_C0002G0048 [Candidatus Daviesbacteria bacterium GW2011_GWB1_41_5]OGE70930.1 MAG: hypothetical protein A2617_04485 [Candidatus Daviesbacteria bacterium RIFOXYD1_FULL_41_10]